MSDDNSSPESVSDPEANEDQPPPKEAKAPAGEGAAPRAKGGSSTWFIIGFVVLLVVVGALVIFFVAGGLNPSGGANSTDTSMPDELGTGGMTQMSAMTTAGGEGAPNAMLRAYESLSEPVYSQLAFTEQRSMYTDQDNRCPYEMFTVGAQVIEFRGTIWNKNLDIHPVLQGSDPEDHFMTDIIVRLDKRDLREDKGAYVAIVLPATPKNTTLFFHFNGCMKVPVHIETMNNVDAHLPRIRYKVVQMMKQQKHESVSDIKCSDLIDPRVKDRIAIRVLLDFAYGRKSPELRVVHCTLQDRKCRVIYKVQADGLSTITSPARVMIFSGKLPSNTDDKKRKTSPVLESSVAIESWCMPSDGDGFFPNRLMVSEDSDNPGGFVPPDGTANRRWFD